MYIFTNYLFISKSKMVIILLFGCENDLQLYITLYSLVHAGFSSFLIVDTLLVDSVHCKRLIEVVSSCCSRAGDILYMADLHHSSVSHTAVLSRRTGSCCWGIVEGTCHVFLSCSGILLLDILLGE